MGVELHFCQDRLEVPVLPDLLEHPDQLVQLDRPAYQGPLDHKVYDPCFLKLASFTSPIETFTKKVVLRLGTGVIP
jgi:hypothetical protein